MSPLNQNPEAISETFSKYVRAIVYALVWLIAGLASLAAAVIALRGIWIAVKYVFKIIS